MLQLGANPPASPVMTCPPEDITRIGELVKISNFMWFKSSRNEYIFIYCKLEQYVVGLVVLKNKGMCLFYAEWRIRISNY